jgi:hypothetical protein
MTICGLSINTRYGKLAKAPRRAAAGSILDCLDLVEGWYRVCLHWLPWCLPREAGAWSSGDRDRGAWSTEGGEAVVTS